MLAHQDMLMAQPIKWNRTKLLLDICEKYKMNVKKYNFKSSHKLNILPSLLDKKWSEMVKDGQQTKLNWCDSMQLIHDFK